MPFDPKFSAHRFQNVMGKATGLGVGSALRSTLARAGQNRLAEQNSVTVQDARRALRVMKNKGLLTDTQMATANRVMAKEEGLARQRAWQKEKDFKAENLARFKNEVADDSVVQQQQHAVSAFDKNLTQHAVGVGQLTKPAVSVVSQIGRQVATSITSMKENHTVSAAATKNNSLLDLPIG